MTVTQSQSKVPASINNVAVGRYLNDGTAAEFTITTGFKPRYVQVVNVGATGLAKLEWFEGMTDGTALLTITNGTMSVSTDGIEILSNGFTVEINTDVNITNEQLSWMAIG